MKLITSVLFVFVFIVVAHSQEKLDYYLPADVSYNPEIPTPEEFFSQEVGEWHLTFDQILSYMKEIAKVSDRATIQEYARSYENRPLVNVIFSSPKNQQNLEALRELHLKHADPAKDVPNDDAPLVVRLGYSIHGNESSGANSSVLTAYYLAAAQGEKIDQILANTVILVDPCLNPDGFTRHSTWANMNQSAVGIANNDNRQFHEMWPGGRTNHYWFDLNRDYLLLVNPESVGRVKSYYEWLPNVVTDHHEMGSNSTFFFQPGVPSRNNPLTPEKNYELTREIAHYHARYLDKIGSEYFTEEEFDDYYIGKGSSYPDITSGVGILFEQAGFRGRNRETENGVRRLSFAIRNQFTVTLSTLDAAMHLRNDLLDHQKQFFREALQLAEKDPVKAYVFGNDNDRLKTLEMVKLLQEHNIDVFTNQKQVVKDGKTFNSETSFIVPVKQKQYRLLKALFQRVTEFTDSTFYDVSTWTLPLTFNVDCAEINSLKEVQYTEKAKTDKIEGKIIGDPNGVAYLMKWNEYLTPKALYQLQNAGLRTKVATEKFTFTINGKQENFDYGTVLIQVKNQTKEENALRALVAKIASETGIDFYSTSTGLSNKGIDWGSNNFVNLEKPSVLVMVGGSVSSSEAGEIWQLFDQRYQVPVTIAETGDLNTINLDKYNALILPGGAYREWGDSETGKIREWVQQGGTLIACENATVWASRNNLGKMRFKKNDQKDTTVHYDYVDREKEFNLTLIRGAIFETALDLSHPLCFGYTENTLPVFKTGTTVAESLNEEYSEPVKFTGNPYLSGFISNKNLERLKNAPVVSVQSIGKGKLISYQEDMIFRGIWLGTAKLFSNAVFFGSVIK